MLDSDQKDTLINVLNAENAQLRLLLMQYQVMLTPKEEADAESTD